MKRELKRKVRRWICSWRGHRTTSTFGGVRFDRPNGEHVERWGVGYSCRCGERSKASLYVADETSPTGFEFAGSGVIAKGLVVPGPANPLTTSPVRVENR